MFIIKDFDIELGPNEKAIGELTLWYDSNNTSEFKIKFGNLNASGNAVAGSEFIYAAQVIKTIATDGGDNTPTTGLEAVVIRSTDGDGPVIILDTDSSNTDARWTKVEFNVINSTAEHTTLSFSAGEAADGSDCHLLAGSYSAYKKF